MSNIGPRETFLGLQSRAIYWERDGLDPSVRPPARGGAVGDPYERPVAMRVRRTATGPSELFTDRPHGHARS